MTKYIVLPMLMILQVLLTISCADDTLNTKTDFVNGVKLYPVYPNPISIACNVRMELLEQMHIVLTLENSTGDVIKEIANTNFEAGIHEFQIMIPTNSNGETYKGIYFIHLTTSSNASLRTMVVVKTRL